VSTENTLPDESIRPWGSYEILDSQQTFKVKRITVMPGKRLSYQSHEKRAEHWFAVAGIGVVTIDDVEYEFTPNKSFTIAIGQKHRIANAGSQELVFIEVQTGTYFGEDDIHRYDDDFGRIS
jgi:mannose-6-phosphate isomerase-like protein (cupin superfamily)